MLTKLGISHSSSDGDKLQASNSEVHDRKAQNCRGAIEHTEPRWCGLEKSPILELLLLFIVLSCGGRCVCLTFFLKQINVQSLILVISVSLTLCCWNFTGSQGKTVIISLSTYMESSVKFKKIKIFHLPIISDTNIKTLHQNNVWSRCW